MPTLTVYRGDQLQQQLPLGEGVLRIGRAAENDLVLPDDTKGVSRSHAEIRFDRGQYLVADLNSQNGVWLGTRRVRVDPLLPGMPLTIGPYRLVLEDDVPGAGTGTDEGTHGELEKTDAVAETIVDAAPATSPDAAPATLPSSAQATSPGSPPAASAEAGRRRMLVYGGAALAVIVFAAIIVIAYDKAVVPPAPPTSEPPVLTIASDAELEGLIDAMPHVALPVPPAPLEAQPGGGQRGPDLTGDLSGPPTLRIVRNPRETPSQRAARQRHAEDDLREGLKALGAERFADAKRSLEAAISQSGRQDFGTVANEARDALQKANEGLERIADAEQRKRAQQLVDEAQATVASDLVAAVRKLKQARADYPQIGFADLLNGWLERARVQGEATMRVARNYDFASHPLTLKTFEQAVELLELLPGESKSLIEARKRVQELKGGR